MVGLGISHPFLIDSTNITPHQHLEIYSSTPENIEYLLDLIRRYQAQTVLYSSITEPSRPIPKKSFPKPHRTTTNLTMAGSSSSSATIGNPSYGGALSTVPPEIRIKIYRLVINGRYSLSHFLPAANNKNGPALLRVSKAIRHETLAIWLSESTFIFNIDFQDYFDGRVPSKLRDQMKNVELHLENTSEVAEIDDMSRVKSIWETAIAPFKLAQVERNDLFVLFIWGPRPLIFTTIEDILSPILETFKAGARCHTVFFRVKTSEPGYWSPVNLPQLREVARVVNSNLEPVLGLSQQNTALEMPSVEFHPPQKSVDSTE